MFRIGHHEQRLRARADRVCQQLAVGAPERLEAYYDVTALPGGSKIPGHRVPVFSRLIRDQAQPHPQGRDQIQNHPRLSGVVGGLVRVTMREVRAAAVEEATAGGQAGPQQAATDAALPDGGDGHHPPPCRCAQLREFLGAGDAQHLQFPARRVRDLLPAGFIAQRPWGRSTQSVPQYCPQHCPSHQSPAFLVSRGIRAVHSCAWKYADVLIRKWLSPSMVFCG